MAEQFYIGETVVATFRLYTVDPVTGARTPKPDADAVTIRFKNPDGTTLVTRTLASGVTNGGQGYYYGSAQPTTEGLHQIEMEVGSGINQGRSEIKFGVSPF